MIMKGIYLWRETERLAKLKRKMHSLNFKYFTSEQSGKYFFTPDFLEILMLTKGTNTFKKIEIL